MVIPPLWASEIADLVRERPIERSAGSQLERVIALANTYGHGRSRSSSTFVAAIVAAIVATIVA